MALLGRDPQPESDDEIVTLVAIDDPERSISKTHLALGLHDMRIWAEDRHSTNGTTLLDSDGTSIRLAPGRKVVLKPGAVLNVGNHRIEVNLR
jgi:predicted component of type VI protein secretion system